MIKLSEIFDVYYGVNLELNALTPDNHGINFISRTEKRNGVSAKVKYLKDIEPIGGGTISVAGGGSVMASFLQIRPYYSGRDLFYLVPKINLTNEMKLYYCVCLKLNKFKFNFGRQANATLEDLLIPSIEEIPQWVKNFSIKKYAVQLLASIKLETIQAQMQISENNENVLLSDLFIPFNGIASSEVKRYATKIDDSYVPYIRPSYKQETSIDAFVSKESVDIKYLFPHSTLYVSTDGQGSHTFAYVSVGEFVPNSNVTVLVPKNKMNLQEKLYYAKCITNNRFKFSYGRKPKGDRLLSIILPKYPPNPIIKYDIDNIITEFKDVIDKL